MAQGLQVFDASGVSVLNTNDRTLKTLGIISIHTGYEVSKTVVHGAINQGDGFWYSIIGEITPPYDIRCELQFKPNNIGIMQANVTLTASTSVVQQGGKIHSALFGVY